MILAIVDDHKLFGESIINYLSVRLPSEGIAVEEYHVFTRNEDLLTHVEYSNVDVVLMDISLKDGMNGFDASFELMSRKPTTKIILVSMHTHKEYVNRAISVGVHGYIYKDSDSNELVKAIKQVSSDGNFYCSEDIVIENPFDILSKTERKIVLLLLQDKTNNEVAEELFRSRQTIETHRKNIYNKLNITSSIALSNLARMWYIENKPPGKNKK